MAKLKDGMGDKLTVVSNLAGTFIISVCEAFPLGWELTLACLAIVPFSIASSVWLSNVSAHFSKPPAHAKLFSFRPTAKPTFSSDSM